jgi:hypothetical protein
MHGRSATYTGHIAKCFSDQRLVLYLVSIVQLFESSSVEETDEQAQRKLYIKDKILTQGRKISAAKKSENHQ